MEGNSELCGRTRTSLLSRDTVWTEIHLHSIEESHPVHFEFGHMPWDPRVRLRHLIIQVDHYQARLTTSRFQLPVLPPYLWMVI